MLDRPATDGLQPPPAAVMAPPPGSDTTRTLPFEPVVAPAPRTVHEFGDIGVYIVRRLLALIIDIAVVGALFAIIARTWLLNSSPSGNLSLLEFRDVLIATGAALFVYRCAFEGLAGSTPGKLLMGLAVGSVAGGRAGLGRAFIRTIFLAVDLAVIGFLFAALTPRRRRIGDLVAGTVVANSKIGALAPLVGLVLLGAAGYGVYQYSGVAGAQSFLRDASQLTPQLLELHRPSPTPPPPTSPATMTRPYS